MQARLCYAIARALLGSGLLVSALPTLAQACAVCVGSSPEDAGYFWGVLFLMAMPFAVGGLVGGWLWYHYRRGLSRARRQPSSKDPAAVQLQPPRPLPDFTTALGPYKPRPLGKLLVTGRGTRRRVDLESSCCHARTRS